jgi:hypothetical protein
MSCPFIWLIACAETTIDAPFGGVAVMAFCSLYLIR